MASNAQSCDWPGVGVSVILRCTGLLTGEETVPTMCSSPCAIPAMPCPVELSAGGLLRTLVFYLSLFFWGHEARMVFRVGSIALVSLSCGPLGLSLCSVWVPSIFWRSVPLPIGTGWDSASSFKVVFISVYHLDLSLLTPLFLCLYPSLLCPFTIMRMVVFFSYFLSTTMCFSTSFFLTLYLEVKENKSSMGWVFPVGILGLKFLISPSYCPLCGNTLHRHLVLVRSLASLWLWVPSPHWALSLNCRSWRRE